MRSLRMTPRPTLGVSEQNNNSTAQSTAADQTLLQQSQPRFFVCAGTAFPNITDPVGLFIDSEARLLFVGSNLTPTGYAYAYDLDTRQLVQSYTDSGLQHPAGLVSYGGSLYVISQTAGTLMQFNVQSGALTSTLISSFDDVPEQIMLSPC